ncbi:uncharacterized protein F4812DRAFT_465581 [Daldinia caldariorum]|uniref:uncharacterized protein n=1 Tax=Daldinia caldariorum TaxID=326644 RepID=UPI002008AAC1|nr:uncharacterized protein F4812DRAFT_465581 [Daldinia caldariorum]KAI1466936.1 hypothetical protein F4812DRAFT_465581 [Daldinia caldariorum]
MASRYSQPQYRDELSRFPSEATRSHPNLLSSTEPTQAYDSRGERRGRGIKTSHSMQNPQMDRTSLRDPSVENKDVKVTKAFSRWLGKHKAKNAANPERLRISEPQPASLPQAPLRHKHSFNEQAPLPPNISRILPELGIPKPPLKNPSIQKKNLGKSHDALGSYPVGTWLDNSEKTYPPKQILFNSKAGDNENEMTGVAKSRRQSRASPKSVTYESELADDIQSGLAADIRAERRKGRIFSNEDPLKNLYEFPDPDAWYGEEDDESDEDDQFWDDAGFDDSDFGGSDLDDAGFEEAVFTARRERYSANISVPDIVISTPTDEGEPSKRRASSEDLLKPDDVYKVLWKKQAKEIRFLNETQRYLLPLAWLVAEAEGIDVNDLPALEKALKVIISDRRKLFDLFPLAKVLAKDQKVDVNDFKSFPRILKNVLSDRDNAKRLADYHRTAKLKLESKVAQLEAENIGESPDDEDYIRF